MMIAPGLMAVVQTRDCTHSVALSDAPRPAEYGALYKASSPDELVDGDGVAAGISSAILFVLKQGPATMCQGHVSENPADRPYEVSRLHPLP
jgi:hypothetical protein